MIDRLAAAAVAHIFGSSRMSRYRDRDSRDIRRMYRGRSRARRLLLRCGPLVACSRPPHLQTSLGAAHNPDQRH
jgi:hypothetical protein